MVIDFTVKLQFRHYFHILLSSVQSGSGNGIFFCHFDDTKMGIVGNWRPAGHMRPTPWLNVALRLIFRTLIYCSSLLLLQFQICKHDPL